MSLNSNRSTFHYVCPQTKYLSTFRYEYGTRSSRGSYSWWGYDSADDDCEVTYTHNFTPVTERVASSLNLVHKYLNTDSKGTRSHGDTIKVISTLKCCISSENFKLYFLLLLLSFVGYNDLG